MTCDRLHLVSIVGTLLALLQCTPAVAQVSDAHKLLAEADLQLATGYANAERARNFSQYAQEREDVRERLTKFARKVLFALDEDWAKSKLQTVD